MSTKKKNTKKGETKQKQRSVSLRDFPRLQKAKTTRARKDVIDYDYLKKLSREELAFLNQFTDEYYCSNFKGETIHPKSQKKDCEDRVNSRNRDLLTIKEITGGINFVNYGSELDELLETTLDVSSGRDEVMEEIENTTLSVGMLKKLSS